MYKTTCLLLCILVLSFQIIAQVKESRQNIKLQSISNIGLLEGSNGSFFSLQTLLGVQFNKSFSGIGVGLDYYRFRSIPLFVDLRREFGKGPNAVFVYGDMGYNFDWLTDEDKQKTSFSTNADFKGGLYYDAGIGYKYAFKSSHALLFSLGYAYKQIKLNNMVSSFCIGGTCPPETQIYNYSMPRWIVKAGWQF